MRFLTINNVLGSSNCNTFSIYYNSINTNNYASLYVSAPPYPNASNVTYSQLNSNQLVVGIPDNANSIIISDNCNSGCQPISVIFPTQTPTQTPTFTPTNTNTITKTSSSTPSLTKTQTQTQTLTQTSTLTPTFTPTPTITNTPSSPIPAPLGSTCFRVQTVHPYPLGGNFFVEPTGIFNGRYYYKLQIIEELTPPSPNITYTFYIFFDWGLNTWVFKDTLGPTGVLIAYLTTPPTIPITIVQYPWSTPSTPWVNTGAMAYGVPFRMCSSAQSPSNRICTYISC